MRHRGLSIAVLAAALLWGGGARAPGGAQDRRHRPAFGWWNGLGLSLNRGVQMAIGEATLRGG